VLKQVDSGVREYVKRMRCSGCGSELMPGSGLRLRDYEKSEGVVIISYCDKGCLEDHMLSTHGGDE